jgi:hypothetical protein
VNLGAASVVHPNIRRNASNNRQSQARTTVLRLSEAATPITDGQDRRAGVDMNFHFERPARPGIGVAHNVGRELGDDQRRRRPIDTGALPL